MRVLPVEISEKWFPKPLEEGISRVFTHKYNQDEGGL